MQCEHKSTEKDDSKIKYAERKALLPRLVYLSMHGCASSLRETQLNGSGLDTDATEMKPLLLKYARSIGYSIDDALSVILGMSSGKKSVKVQFNWLYMFLPYSFPTIYLHLTSLLKVLFLPLYLHFCSISFDNFCICTLD